MKFIIKYLPFVGIIAINSPRDCREISPGESQTLCPNHKRYRTSESDHRHCSESEKLF